MLPTIHEAAARMRAGELSSAELLEACLANIDRYEERVRAWVLVDRERARAEAKAADGERARGVDRGPLHGIPVGVKDIIDVFDWPTACGSRLWANSYARQDAPVVAKLRHAGAVLVGKTVTTAYASFDPPPTRNPWDLTRTPGGSSSGSAAAVAAGMCLAALGTQTGGSITRPASYCGVAACKPSYRYVSVEGVLPLAASMDHVGAMARCARDVAIVMDAIKHEHYHLSCAEDCDYAKDEPPRLARCRGLFERYAGPETRVLMDAVCVALTGKGAVIEEAALPAAFEDVLSQHRIVMAVEAAAYHEGRFRRHPDDYPPSIISLIEEGLSCPAPRYARAKDLKQQLTRELCDYLGPKALLCPATTGPAPDATTTGDPAFNSPWSFTGAAVVSIPVGSAPDGMPLGVQLVGTPADQVPPFREAAWCERALAVTLGTPRGLV